MVWFNLVLPLTGNNLSIKQTMKKCAILFLIFLAVLVFATVIEKKQSHDEGVDLEGEELTYSNNE